MEDLSALLEDGQRIGAWLLELGLILVLLFWMVGARNRLMRHRAAVNTAWLQIDELLQRRAATLETLLAAVAPSLQDEAASLAALRQALEQQGSAARAVRPKPTRAGRLQAWSAAELALVSPLLRLQALIDQREALREDETVKPTRRALDEQAQKLAYARQAFNAAADDYNTAVAEFPTRLLTRTFGFSRIQRL
ncbi:LemA family protein [Ideonella livida]|uniref:LemA family protein n=1 Tax=Ideonella livida TaxID=2707176 RepID=A0A7C9TJF3_9BURK|nr:LemA family protein [Ideonella livida]NDY90923.1 LemA family protein [Ideonella livida]